MKLEELIYKRMAEYKNLTEHLAVYSGLPAIFSPEAPADDQNGWAGKTQYPKIIYNMDLQANEERNSAGVLEVSLLCQNTEDVIPENIEQTIRECLKDVLLKPETGSPYCFAWTKTERFTMEANKESMVIGSDIRFDILEYPNQETTDPDPIAAVNRFMKDLYPESIVIWQDRMEEVTETSERPAIYCRMVSTESADETYTVAWKDCKIAAHILCPDADVRMKMETAISNQLSIDGEIIMLDDSPMFIRNVQTNYKADYLKSGQIFLTGHYGILKYRQKQHKLQKINMEQGGKRMKADTNGKTETGKDFVKPTLTESSSYYTVSELTENAKNVFEKNPECVAAALKLEGKSEYTISEAKKIIDKFLKKEVQ